MSKQKRKESVRYLVRVTTHKKLKGEFIVLKNQKKEKEILVKSVIIDVPEYTHKVKDGRFKKGYRIEVRNTKKVKVKGYRTQRNAGNDKVDWIVYYAKSPDVVKKLIDNDLKKFKKSKKTFVSSRVQLFQGKVNNYYDGRLIKGSITKAVKMLNQSRKQSQANLLSANIRAFNDYRNLSMDMATDKNNTRLVSPAGSDKVVYSKQTLLDMERRKKNRKKSKYERKKGR